MKKQVYSISLSLFVALILTIFVALTFSSCKTEVSEGNNNEQNTEPDKQEKTISSIYISRNPEKLEYEVGDSFDLRGTIQ